MTISSDIASGKEDLLGRKSFSLEIATGLISYADKSTDPITISITGDWGSGKTTLLQYIVENLQVAKEKYKIIEFNPWMFYKNESIRDAFLIQLALALKDYETSATQVSKKILGFVKAFRWVKYVNATAGNVQDGVENFIEQVSQDDNISVIKDEVEAILLKSNKKIVLFIDDIDRLLPDQITELFQTISLIAHFSNIIYVIAFDRKIVINALNKAFSGHGQDYLEKIVQVDYEVPKIRPEILFNLFTRFLQQVENHNKIKFENDVVGSLWDLHGLKEYFNNLRDFKRYFNSLSFRLPPVTNEINHLDFLVIESIRIFDYQSYSKFYEMCKTNFRKREVTEKILTDDQFKAIASPASDILKSIFPKSTLEVYRKDTNLKRLSDSSYFDRYFSLITGANDIPEKQIKNFIEQPASRNQILNEAVQYGRISDLIKRLSDNGIRKHYRHYDYQMVDDLIGFFNTKPALLGRECNNIADMIVNVICCTEDQNFGLKKFFNSFIQPTLHPSYIHLYFFHYMRKFSNNGRGFRTDHSVFDQYYKVHLPEIEKGYLPFFKSIGDHLLDNRLTVSFPFIKYLYQSNYVQIYPDVYAVFFGKLLEDENYILYLGKQVVLLNDKNNSVFRYNWVANKHLFPGMLFKEFCEAMKKLNLEHLDEISAAIIKHILALDISKLPEGMVFPASHLAN